MARYKCFVLVVCDDSFEPGNHAVLSITPKQEEGPKYTIQVMPKYIEGETMAEIKKKAQEAFDFNLQSYYPEKPVWNKKPANPDYKPSAPVNIGCDSLCIADDKPVAKPVEKPVQEPLKPVSGDLLDLESLL